MTPKTVLPGADISWWSLHFSAPAVERDYQAYRVRHYLREIKRWGIGAIIGNLILGLFESQVLTTHHALAIGLRFGVVLPTLVVIMLLFVYRTRLRAWIDFGFITGVGVYGVVTIALLAYAPYPDNMLYLFSILFASIFLFGHMGIRFIQASVVSWSLVVAYIIAAGLADQDVDASTRLLNTLLLVTTNALIMLAGFNHEILARREYRRALMQDNESKRLAEAQRIAGLGSWDWDLADDVNTASAEYRRLLGLDPNIPADRQTFLDAIHSADLDGVKQALQSALAGGAAFEIEHRSIGPGGDTRILHSRADVTFDDQHHPTRVTGTIQDVTERRRLEAQLRRAQRLEAIGGLTGGIAHEFNNLLLVIHANLELLGDGVGDNDVRRRFLDAALRGSVRGAELTQRLLAFSRRQTLKPELCDLNDVVRELQGMAGPLGERLATKMVLAADLWATRIDTGQMENALLNLAINARDAMPGGGSMTIETANVTLDGPAATALDEEASPGDYVAVSVSDTGSGMADDVASQVFEPFFTTKEVGKGTGLGLSMVHGFAKQSGGHVALETALDVGTTVRIYLPRVVLDTTSERDAGP